MIRIWIVAALGACSSMPGVSGNPLGEPGTASLSVTPDDAKVAAGGTPFTISNTGDGASGAIGALITGDDASAFAIGNSSCSELQPGAACQVDVFFLSVDAASSATLDITDDNEDRTSATLEAGDTNANPHITVEPLTSTLLDTSCGHGFGTGNTIQIKVTNHTHAALGQIATGAVGLTVSGCTGTIADGASCTLAVGFQSTKVPSPLAGVSFVVVGTANGTNYSDSAALHTEIDACLIDVTPDPLEVVGKIPGLTEVPLTIANHSATDAVLLGAGSLVPDPSLGNLITTMPQSCGSTLGAGQQCKYKIAYIPPTVDRIYAGGFQITASTITSSTVTQTSITQVAAAVGTDGLAFAQVLYDWGTVTIDGTMANATDETIVLTSSNATGAIAFTIPPPWKVDGGNPCVQGLPQPAMGATSTCSFKLAIETSAATPGLVQAGIIATGQIHGSASAVLSARIQ